jgi:putative transcriptional regulator
MEHIFNSLKDHFLIAMPSLTQGIFARSVTYLCGHNEQGAMGIVINQPLDLKLREILDHLDVEGMHSHFDQLVMAGGPVQTERGFVLHRTSEKQWETTVAISADISLTTSRDILDAFARDEGPSASLVALGYAGWSAGQLESELADNAWLTVPADSDILFDTPISQRLDAAVATLGIDLSMLAPGAGHA